MWIRRIKFFTVEVTTGTAPHTFLSSSLDFISLSRVISCRCPTPFDFTFENQQLDKPTLQRLMFEQILVRVELR